MTDFPKSPPAGGLLLSDQERERFAAWLEWEAQNGLAMAELMEKQKLPAVLISKERAEAMAAKILAQKLRSTETMTVGG